MKRFIKPEMNINVFEKENVVTTSAQLDDFKSENGFNGTYKTVDFEKILGHNNVQIVY